MDISIKIGQQINIIPSLSRILSRYGQVNQGTATFLYRHEARS